MTSDHSTLTPTSHNDIFGSDDSAPRRSRMASQMHIRATGDQSLPGKPPPADPCIMVIFGASGDLTKRLLVPALFNLACDGLLSEHFAVTGMAMDDWTSEV